MAADARRFHPAPPPHIAHSHRAGIGPHRRGGAPPAGAPTPSEGPRRRASWRAATLALFCLALAAPPVAAQPTITVTSDFARVRDDASRPEGSGVVRFTFRLSEPTVDVLIIGTRLSGTATLGSDFTTPPLSDNRGRLGERIRFPIGGTEVIAEARINVDSALEGIETLTVTIDRIASDLTLQGYRIGSPNSATVMIDNGDFLLTVTRDVGQIRDDASRPTGSGISRFTFRLSQPPTRILSVETRLTGSAGSGDFTNPGGLGQTIRFPVGTTERTAEVTARVDSLIEGPETIVVEISRISTNTNQGFRIGSPRSATVTIVDGNALVTVTRDVARIREEADPTPDPGPGTASFTFLAAGKTGGEVVLETRLSGTAVPGLSGDYTTPTRSIGGRSIGRLGGRITIPAGRASVTVSALASDDLLVEGDETLSVTITRVVSDSSGRGFTVGSPNTASVTIDDLHSPSTLNLIAPQQLTLREGVTGEKNVSLIFRFPFGVRGVAAPVFIPFTVGKDPEGRIEGVFDGKFLFDRGDRRSGRLRIAPADWRTVRSNAVGEASTEITFSRNFRNEATRTMTLTFGTPTTTTGVVRRGEKKAVRISIADSPDDTILYSLVSPPSLDVAEGGTFLYQLDFAAACGDTRPPLTENIPREFPCNSAPVIVNYTISGAGVTADDFSALPGQMAPLSLSGSLTIQKFRPLDLPPPAPYAFPIATRENGDPPVDEAFTLTITSVTTAGAVRARGPTTSTATILGTANVAIAAVPSSIDEGDEAVFTLTARGSTLGPITTAEPIIVSYRTVSGTADTTDFTPVAAMPLTLPAGRNPTVEIRVPTVDDDAAEGTETFSVEIIGTPSGGALAPSVLTRTATTAIRDNDASLEIQRTTPASGPVDPGSQAIFTVTRRGDLRPALTVPYTVTGVQAADYRDLNPTPGTLTIPANAESTTLPLQILADRAPENPETLTVTIGAVTIDDKVRRPSLSTGTLSIVTDDGTVSTAADASASARVTIRGVAIVSIAGPGSGVGEGNDAVFTVRVAGTTTAPVTLSYTVSASGDSAAEPEDLGNLGGPEGTPPRNTVALQAFPSAVPLSVPAGVNRSETTLELPIFDDEVPDEDRETFTVTLAIPETGAGGGENVAVRLDGGRRAAQATIAMSDASGHDARITLLPPGRPGAGCEDTAVPDNRAFVREGETARFRVCVEGTLIAPVTLPYTILSWTPGDEVAYLGLGGDPGPVSPEDLELDSLKPFDKDNCPTVGLRSRCRAALSLPAVEGTRKFTIDIPIVKDDKNESGEGFFLRVVGSMPEGVSFPITEQNVLPTFVGVEIAASDPVVIGIGDPTPAAASEGSTLLFPLSFGGGIPESTVVVEYSIGGTEVAAGDFDLGTRGLLSGRFTLSRPRPARFTPEQIRNATAARPLGISLRSTQNATLDDDKRFTVTLSGRSGIEGVGGARIDSDRQSASATLRNDDVLLALRGPTGPLREGETATFTITRSGDLRSPVTVPYTIMGDVDAMDIEGPLRGNAIVPGAVAGAGPDSGRRLDLGIRLREDGAIEGRERLTVTIGGEGALRPTLPDGNGGTLLIVTEDGTASAAADASARASVTVAGQPGVISIAGPSDPVTEGEDAVFTVLVEGRTTAPVTVNYTVAGSGARAAEARDLSDGGATPMRLDEFPRNVSLTIPRGVDQRRKITVPIFDDAEDEGQESLAVTLRQPAGGGEGVTPTLRTASARAAIAASDLSGTISIEAPTRAVAEGTSARFTVMVSGTTTQAVTVRYKVGGPGDASPGDFEAPNLGGSSQASHFDELIAEVEIPAGRHGTRAEIQIPIVADGDDREGPESFTVTLVAEGAKGQLMASPRGGGRDIELRIDPARKSATATIAVSQPTTVVSIEGPANAVAEGAEAVFDVVAVGIVNEPVTVRYRVGEPGDASPGDFERPNLGGGVLASDFRQLSDEVTIQGGRAGNRAKIEIPIALDDDDDEAPESFTVTLVAEGAKGQLMASPRGGGPGITPVLGTASATGTIAASSGRAVVSIAGPRDPVAEGEEAVFTVTATGTTTTEPVRVLYTVSAAGAGAATAGDLGNSGEGPDTRARNTAALETFPTAVPFEIPAGANQSATLRVPVFDDRANEAVETFTVTLQPAADPGGGAGITPILHPRPGATEATATITANDRPAVVSIAGSAAVIAEGGEAVFTIAARGTTTEPVRVLYTVSAAGAGAATAGDLGNSGEGLDTRERNTAPLKTFPTAVPFEIPAGANRSETLRVPVFDDTSRETAETFTVTLRLPADPGGGQAVTPTLTTNPAMRSAMTTIAASDGPAVVSIAAPTAAVAEGEEAVFTVTVAGTTTEPVRVLYTVRAAGDDAAMASDLGNSGERPSTLARNTAALATFPTAVPFEIPAGTNHREMLLVPVFNDEMREAAETFTVTLSLPDDPGGGAGITPSLDAASSATATIAANDGPVVVAIAGPAAVVPEGGEAAFTVLLTGTTTEPLAVTYTVGTRMAAPSPAMPGDLGISGGGNSLPRNSRALSVFPTGVRFKIPPGANQRFELRLPVFDDDSHETAETFTVTLELPVDPGGGAEVTPSVDPARKSATATIAASDGAAVVSIAGPPAVVAEGNTAEFTVTVTGTTTEEVVVTYDVTASGDDPIEAGDLGNAENSRARNSFPTNAVLRVPAGTNRRAKLSLQIFDDGDAEGRETFTVTLSGAKEDGVSLPLGERVATATIATSVQRALVSIAGPSDVVAEGGESAGFTVTVTGTTTEEVVVTYGVTASGDNPIEAEDLGNAENSQARNSFPNNEELRIPAGTKRQANLPLRIFDDGDAEGRETFTVTLVSAEEDGVSLLLGERVATATIAASDIHIPVSIEPFGEVLSQDEIANGISEGRTAPIPFRILLNYPRNSPRASETIVLVLTIAAPEPLPAGSRAARPGEDVTPAFLGIGAGAAELTTNRPSIREDDEAEGSEAFFFVVEENAGRTQSEPHGGEGVTLSFGANARWPRTGSLTLLDNDVSLAIARTTPASGSVSAGQTAIFTVTRSGDLRPAVRVPYTIGGAGIDAGDFRIPDEDPPRGLGQRIAMLEAREASTTIEIEIQSDRVADAEETLTVTLGGEGDGRPTLLPVSSRGTVSIDTASASVTIAASTARPEPPQISISGPAQGVAEGETATFTVTRSGDLRPEVTVPYTVTGVGAGDYDDPSVPPGALTLPANAPSATLSLLIAADGEAEGPETLTVTIRPGLLAGETGVGSVAVRDGEDSASVTIAASTARPEPPQISISGPAQGVAEGKTATFTVTRSGDLRPEVTVPYTVTGVGAGDYDDPNVPPGALTLPANAPSATLPLLIAADGEAEGPETLTVTIRPGLLAGETGVGSVAVRDGEDSARVTIAASTARSRVSISGPERDVTEGGTAIFTVTFDGDTSSLLAIRSLLGIRYTVSGTAPLTPGDLATDGGGNNFGDTAGGAARSAFQSNERVFSSPANTATIPIQTFDDGFAEGAETLTVTLTAPDGIDVNPGSATATIAASDPLSVSIGAPTPARIAEDEAEAANRRVAFPIALGDGIPTGDVTVTYDIVGAVTAEDFASATTGTDLTSLTGVGQLSGLSAEFPATELQDGVGTLTLVIANDGDAEGDEAFDVVLTGVSGGGPGVTASVASGENTSGTATIAASDPLSVSIGDPTPREADEGSSFAFPIALGGTPTGQVTIRYDIFGAVTAGDFAGATTGMDSTSLDAVAELDGQEAVFATGAIRDGTGTLTLVIADDGDAEGEETFRIELTGVRGGGPGVSARVAPREGVSGTAAIRASDPLTVSIGAPTPTEADEGSGFAFPLTFRGGTLPADGNAQIEVRYRIAGQSVSPGDFRGLSVLTDRTRRFRRGDLTIDADTTPPTMTATLTLQTENDREAEGNETFTVTLEPPVTPMAGNTTNGDGSTLRPTVARDAQPATATVLDNDVSLAISRTTPASGPVGAGETATFTITRSRGDHRPAVRVPYTIGGAGIDAEDFRVLDEDPPRGLGRRIAMLGAGEASTTIEIEIQSDRVADAEETLTVTLGGEGDGRPTLLPESSRGTVSIDTPSASVTIAESAAAPVTIGLDITGPADPVTEGQPAAFTVTRSGNTGAELTILYTVSGEGSLTAGDLAVDGDPAQSRSEFSTNEPLVFSAGDATAMISIPIYDDRLAEDEETFTVTAAAPTGATFSLNPQSPSATATIAGSDRIQGLDLTGPATVFEGATATYEVALAQGSDVPTQPLNLSWRVVERPEVANPAEMADFLGGTFSQGTVSLLVGEVSGTFTIAIAEDAAAENDEQFIVEVSLPGENAALPRQTQVTTIEDNDVGIDLSAQSGIASEGTTAVFFLTRGGDLGPNITVTYTVEEGEGLDAADYRDLTGGSVEIPSGATEARIQIEIADDGVDEDDETLRVMVSGANVSAGSQPGLRSGGEIVLGTGSAEVKIPRLRIGIALSGPRTVEEGAEAVFVIDLQLTPEDAVTPLDVVVGYQLGGAEPGSYEGRVAQRFVDYASPASGAGTLVIPAGQRGGSFAVPAIRDGQLEDVEVFSVALVAERSSGGGGTLEVATTPRLVRILDGADQAERREQRTRGMLAATHRSAANLATNVITTRMGRKREATPSARSEASAATPSEVRQPGKGVPSPTTSMPAYVGGSADTARAESHSGRESTAEALPRYAPRSTGGDIATDAVGTALRLAGLSGAVAAGGDPTAAGSETAALLAGIDTPVRPLETGPAEASYGADMEAGTVDRDLDLRLPSLGQLLEGARFELSGEEMGWGGLGEGLGVWGAGAFHSLEGDPVLGGGRLDYDGESYGLFVGADKRLALSGGESELVAGAALGWTRGDLDFRDRALQAFALEGRFESELLSLHPYASLRLSPNTQLWLVAGYGWGEVEIEEREERPDGGVTTRRVETDTTMWMVSAGAEASATVPGLGEASQLTVRLRGTRTGGDLERARFDDGVMLRGTRARTWRVAGELEGSYRVDLPGGGSLRPFVTTRLRGDAGDDLGDDWEFAVDLGGGAELAWPDGGLTLALKGLAQLNQGTGQREHSVSVSASYDLDADGRGLLVSLESSLAGSGRLGRGANGRGYGRELFGSGGWAPPGDHRGVGGLGGSSALRRSLQGEVGYGLPWLSFWTPGLLTPYARFELAPHGRGYGGGLRFESEGGVSLSVEGAMEIDSGTGTDSSDQPDYQLRLQGEVEF